MSRPNTCTHAHRPDRRHTHTPRHPTRHTHTGSPSCEHLGTRPRACVCAGLLSHPPRAPSAARSESNSNSNSERARGRGRKEGGRGVHLALDRHLHGAVLVHHLVLVHDPVLAPAHVTSVPAPRRIRRATELPLP
eukprot:2964165-Rhodomonas_salina.3